MVLQPVRARPRAGQGLGSPQAWTRLFPTLAAPIQAPPPARPCPGSLPAHLVSFFFFTHAHTIPTSPVPLASQQGRVRTKTVKKASRNIIEKYYARLTLDFATNQRVCEEVAIIQSKRLRNKIAGFTTHLMKRIQRGPVRGISLKLQEEERERRLDYVPEVSAINTDAISVDADTAEMLKAVGLATLPGVKVAAADRGEGGVPGFAGGRERRPRAAAGAN